ncbi:hypothetical protein ACFMPD_13890 [Sedimentitalea sp. HM32M-2]|uniref:hypothetical protein n=1 Tax=Sedimentitalea sp. HM32M-2 TaxID=3351566 RepID=UPI003643E208
MSARKSARLHDAACHLVAPALLALALTAPVAAQQAADTGPVAPEFASMETRIGQLVEILETGDNCPTVATALDLTLGLVYGGTRPLPSKIPQSLDEARELYGPDISQRELDIAGRSLSANKVISATAARVTAALAHRMRLKSCPAQAGLAADLKFHLEEIEDVAAALGEYTALCGVGDSLVSGICAQLAPVLDEQTGHILTPAQIPKTITRGFWLKLRSPFIPRYNRRWQEYVRVIPPMDFGQCSAVFKETKGLMLRLRLDGFTVVRDPWATADLPRGTRIPIWTLEWVPSEYVKHFNICNTGDGVTSSVSQRVKQDIPLNYFWRYFAK